MYDFYMRPKNSPHGITKVGFTDLRSFMEFVKNVGEVTIVEGKKDEPMNLLVPDHVV